MSDIGRTRIKICGLTKVEDVEAAVALGADCLGFVLAPSPRRVSPEQIAEITAGVPAGISKIGVFVDAPVAGVIETVKSAALDLVQLHGSEDEIYTGHLRRAGIGFIKVYRLGRDRGLPAAVPPGCRALLFDTFLPGIAGGAGRSFDWSLVADWTGAPFFLAGGLEPGNVTRALEMVEPYGVDVSSGVEAAPGVKDYDKLKRFINAVRVFDARPKKRIER